MSAVDEAVATSEFSLAVLNVDDELEVEPLRVWHRERLGASVEAVDSLEKAERWLTNHFTAPSPLPVIVLLDLMFPAYSQIGEPPAGLSFLSRLRSGLMRGVPATTPVIVRSAMDDPETRTEAYKRGANSFIVKASDPKHLVAQVNLYSGREIKTASVLCQVLELDYQKRCLRIRFRGSDDWVAERMVDFDLCPNDSRVVGGTFYLDTYQRYEAGKSEVRIRGQAIERKDDEQVLADLLDD